MFRRPRIDPRRFLVRGGAAPGIWVADRGFHPLPASLATLLAGRCTFCERPPQAVDSLAGALGRTVRVCGDCAAIGLHGVTAAPALFTPGHPELPGIPAPGGLLEIELHGRQGAWHAAVESARQAVLDASARPEVWWALGDLAMRLILRKEAAEAYGIAMRGAAPMASLMALAAHLGFEHRDPRDHGFMLALRVAFGDPSRAAEPRRCAFCDSSFGRVVLATGPVELHECCVGEAELVLGTPEGGRSSPSAGSLTRPAVARRRSRAARSRDP